MMRQRNRSITAGSMFDSIPRMLHARLLVLATGICPSFVMSFAAPPEEGAGKDRVRAAPTVSCAGGRRKDAHEQTGSAETLRPSLRNGWTAYAVLSLVTGCLATIISVMREHHRRLDASSRGVRTTRFCRRQLPPHVRTLSRATTGPAPTAACPHVRDVRERPSGGTGCAD